MYYYVKFYLAGEVKETSVGWYSVGVGGRYVWVKGQIDFAKENK